MKDKGWKTAKELMDELAKDPEYLRRRAEKDERRRRRDELYDQLTKPILDTLRSHGFDASSIDDLVKEHAPLSTAAVEILLDSVEKCDNDRMCESLVRALGAAEKPFDGRVLASKYDQTHDEGLRFAVLNTIAMARPHSISAWLDKIRQNPFLRKTLTDLGYQW